MEQKAIYLDATRTPQERAEDLLSRMSLEQKFAQLQCGYLYEADQKSYDGIGQLGALFFQADTAEEWADKIESVQKAIIESSEFGIPAIIHQEALTGAVIPQAVIFETGIGQGATWDPESVEKMAEIGRKQLKAVGIRQALSPVMDICRDARWGRLGETYGEDPALSSAMSVAFVKGMQGEDLKEGVIATAKHFLGYGASEGGINMAACPVPERVLREVYAAPFQAAITEAGLQSVMNSYGSINGEVVVGSKKYLNDLLREEMGFDGMVVSDYTSLCYLQFRFHVAETLLEAGKMGLRAGLDVECPLPLGYSTELLEEIKAGRFDEAYVDRACLRVLTAKFKLGLFENPYPDRESLKKEFHNPEYEAICLENAKKSLVLLKNNGILPLRSDVKKIVVIGPHVGSMRQLFGCYTWPAMMEMYADFSNGAIAGGEGAEAAAKGETDAARIYYPGSKLKVELPQIEEKIRKDLPECLTLLETIRKRCPQADVVFEKGFDYTGTDESGFERAMKAAEDADVVIVPTGGKYGWGATVTTGECMDASEIGLPGVQEKFLQKLTKENPNVVVLHFQPLYYFGYGLSYTKFEYSNVQVEKDRLSAEETLKVSVEVQNIGDVSGDEVVQVYVKDLYSSVVRPVKQLTGFKRVTLQSGEKKKISFAIPISQMAFLDETMQWKVESGAMEVQVGASSDDIRQTIPFEITTDRAIDGKTRGFYQMGSCSSVE